MRITKRITADKIGAYLRNEIALPELVDWAEQALLDGDFPAGQAAVLSDVVSRLGVADVRAFGLSWADCQDLLRKLGFSARVEVVAA